MSWSKRGHKISYIFLTNLWFYVCLFIISGGVISCILGLCPLAK
jgi:hypothetical protein